VSDHAKGGTDVVKLFSSIWWVLAGLAWVLAGGVSPAGAGYRGLTDEHMVGYINANRVITIDDGLGGHVQGMVHMLSKIADTDRRVVIDGPCRSACTLLMALGPSRVCVTPRAELWFHQASLLDGQRSRYWSNTMLRLYPAGIRSYVRGRGGLGRKWIILKGKRLARLFPSRCGRGAPAQQRQARPAVPAVSIRDWSFASGGR
jgi:hypothetical protein